MTHVAGFDVKSGGTAISRTGREVAELLRISVERRETFVEERSVEANAKKLLRGEFAEVRCGVEQREAGVEEAAAHMSKAFTTYTEGATAASTVTFVSSRLTACP